MGVGQEYLVELLDADGQVLVVLVLDEDRFETVADTTAPIALKMIELKVNLDPKLNGLVESFKDAVASIRFRDVDAPVA